MTNSKVNLSSGNTPRTEELYKEFLNNFPSFEKMVDHYYSKDENSIKIITKKKKMLVFSLVNGGIELLGA